MFAFVWKNTLSQKISDSLVRLWSVRHISNTYDIWVRGKPFSRNFRLFMQPSVFQFSALDDTLRLTTNCDKFKFQSFVPDSSKRVSLTFYFSTYFWLLFRCEQASPPKNWRNHNTFAHIEPWIFCGVFCQRGLKSQL